MEQVRFNIPWSFIKARMVLSWGAILFGIENGLAAPTVPVEAAMDRLDDAEDTAPQVLDLAIAEKGEPVHHLVQALAAAELPTEGPAHSQAWLYLVMAWAYEHRNDVSDPLGIVEMIYADFGYPESISGLVRYMPTEEPDLGSVEANELRLLKRWESFLVEQQAAYSGPVPD